MVEHADKNRVAGEVDPRRGKAGVLADALHGEHRNLLRRALRCGDRPSENEGRLPAFGDDQQPVLRRHVDFLELANGRVEERVVVMEARHYRKSRLDAQLERTAGRRHLNEGALRRSLTFAASKTVLDAASAPVTNSSA